MHISITHIQKNKKGCHFLSGYTIVELLVVLSIIALVLGIVIPRLNRSAEGTKLRTITDSIVGLLETAKSYATAQHTYCALFHDSNEEKVVMMRKDVDDADRDDDKEEMIQFDRGIDIPSGITVYLTADDTVTFNPWGGVDNPDDTITVRAGSINKQKTITINSVTGYVQVS